MAARSKARKRAVDVLYESDLRSTDPLTTLADRVALAEPPVHDYTVELVEGVHTNRARIDEVLTDYAEGWSVARMPDVDRAVLRLAVFELLWRDDVPGAVVIDEAVELAKSLSTDESPRFVNGVLARVLRDQPEATPPPIVPDDDGVSEKPAPAQGGDAPEPAPASLDPVHPGSVDAAPAPVVDAERPPSPLLE